MTVDGVGKVNLSQFKVGLERTSIDEKDENMKNIFDAIDTNKDGVIDKDELSTYKESIDTNDNGKIRRKEIRKFKKDLDGKIKNDEIRNFLKENGEMAEGVTNVENAYDSVIITYEDGSKKIVNSDKSYSTVVDDGEGKVTTTFFDKDGMAVSRNEKKGAKTSYYEFVNGTNEYRIKSEVTEKGSGLKENTTYEYNDDGTYVRTTENSDGSKTICTFNEEGKIIPIKREGGGLEEAQVEAQEEVSQTQQASTTRKKAATTTKKPSGISANDFNNIVDSTKRTLHQEVYARITNTTNGQETEAIEGILDTGIVKWTEKIGNKEINAYTISDIKAKDKTGYPTYLSIMRRPKHTDGDKGNTGNIYVLKFDHVDNKGNPVYKYDNKHSDLTRDNNEVKNYEPTGSEPMYTFSGLGKKYLYNNKAGYTGGAERLQVNFNGQNSGYAATDINRKK